MADQIPVYPNNHHDFIGAISSAEQLLYGDDNDQSDDPLLDDVVNGMMEEMGGAAAAGNHGTEFPDIGFIDETTQFADSPPTPAFGNPMRIPIWPVPLSPYSCSCCQTLREFCHVNGSHVLKLGIHGRLGIISHAVLERYDTNVSSQNQEFYMFDFCKESIGSVKQFLIQYCNDRRSEGYIMLQDPLSNFYNALCTGLDGNSSPEAGPHQTSQGVGQSSHEGGLNRPEEEGIEPKSFVALQRERAAKMTLRDVAMYFHLPINEASDELNLCPSAIKGICRRGGLKRWPHRKIRSIKKDISKLQESLNSANENEKSRLLVEMQRLQQKLGKFYQEID